MMTVIRIYWKGKGNVRKTVNIEERNQRTGKRIHRTVIATIRKIENEGVRVAAIGRKKPRNLRNIKKKIRNDGTINYLLSREDLKNTGDLDRLVDDNIYSVYYTIIICVSFFNKTYSSIWLKFLGKTV